MTYKYNLLKINSENSIDDIEMGEFKVTGIEKEDVQEIFNGKEEINEDEKSGLKEVVRKQLVKMLG